MRERWDSHSQRGIAAFGTVPINTESDAVGQSLFFITIDISLPGSVSRKKCVQMNAVD